jgi:hypothetical protein
MRYAQPQSGSARLDPAFGCTFATLGSISGIDLVSGAVKAAIGTPAVCPAGPYRNLSSNAATQSFNTPLPAAKYTVVTVFVPVASITGTLVRTTTNGFRVEFSNTGGGVYYLVTNNGVANGPQLVSGTVFDGKPWVAVTTYDGTTMRSWMQKIGDSATRLSGSVAMGYAAPSGTLDIGNGTPTQGMVAITVSPIALPDAVATLLLDNPWQLFKSPQRVLKVAGGTQTFTYAAVGGFVLGGTAPVIRSAVKIPAGGITMSGTAAQSRSSVKTTSGGIAFSGTAPQVRSKAVTASGGITLGGTASVLRGLAKTASGGILFAGAASVSFHSAVQTLIVTPVGGMVFAGTAAIVRTTSRVAAGGITLAGSAGVVLSHFGEVVGNWISVARHRRRD